MRVGHQWERRDDAYVANVKKLLSEKVSIRQIAEQLNVGPGVISGLMRRHKLKSKRPPGEPRKAPKVKPQPQSSKPLAAQPIIEDAPPPGGIPLRDLEAHHCRWPLGDPRHPDFGFCGKHKRHGSYCAEHAERAKRRVHEVDA